MSIVFVLKVDLRKWYTMIWGCDSTGLDVIKNLYVAGIVDEADINKILLISFSKRNFKSLSLHYLTPGTNPGSKQLNLLKKIWVFDQQSKITNKHHLKLF